MEFIQADIQHLESSLPSNLKGTFDAVFTNATLHWCKASPGGVLEGVKWLLKPGGRMVFEFGGFGNTSVPAGVEKRQVSCTKTSLQYRHKISNT